MKILVNTSIAIYIVVGFILFVLPSETFPAFYNPILMGSLALVSGILIYLPGVIFRTKDHTKGKALTLMQLVVAVSLLINGAGGLGLYKLYQYGIPYDKFTHFLTPLIFVVGLFYFIKNWFAKSDKTAIITSTILVLLGGVVWEFLEAFSDRAIGTSLLGGGTGGAFWDTFWDTTMNIIGVGVGIVIIRQRLKKGQ